VISQGVGGPNIYPHHMANRCSDEAIRKLCDELNATETQFPRTNLRLVLELGSTQNP